MRNCMLAERRLAKDPLLQTIRTVAEAALKQATDVVW
jgi:hypothetical protein